MAEQHGNGQPDNAPPTFDADFTAALIIMFLVGAGLMTFVMSLAYIKDIDTLRNVPDALWSFICGRPQDNNVVLPLLLTMSTLCFLAGGGVYGWRRFKKRRQAREEQE